MLSGLLVSTTRRGLQSRLSGDRGSQGSIKLGAIWLKKLARSLSTGLFVLAHLILISSDTEAFDNPLVPQFQLLSPSTKDDLASQFASLLSNYGLFTDAERVAEFSQGRLGQYAHKEIALNYLKRGLTLKGIDHLLAHVSAHEDRVMVLLSYFQSSGKGMSPVHFETACRIVDSEELTQIVELAYVSTQVTSEKLQHSVEASGVCNRVKARWSKDTLYLEAVPFAVLFLQGHDNEQFSELVSDLLKNADLQVLTRVSETIGFVDESKLASLVENAKDFHEVSDLAKLEIAKGIMKLPQTEAFDKAFRDLLSDTEFLGELTRQFVQTSLRLEDTHDSILSVRKFYDSEFEQQYLKLIVATELYLSGQVEESRRLSSTAENWFAKNRESLEPEERFRLLLEKTENHRLEDRESEIHRDCQELEKLAANYHGGWQIDDSRTSVIRKADQVCRACGHPEICRELKRKILQDLEDENVASPFPVFTSPKLDYEWLAEFLVEEFGFELAMRRVRVFQEHYQNAILYALGKQAAKREIGRLRIFHLSRILESEELRGFFLLGGLNEYNREG